MDTISAPAAEATRPGSVAPAGWRSWVSRLLRRHTAGTVGGILCLLIALITMLAPWMRPYDPMASDTVHLLQPPTPAHPFGTDAFGRDVLSRVLWRHMVPNMVGPAIVQAATTMGLAIGLVAAFNFLGLGVQPPTPDWGDMVSDGRTYIFTAPYLAFFPGMAITITVIALSFL